MDVWFPWGWAREVAGLGPEKEGTFGPRIYLPEENISITATTTLTTSENLGRIPRERISGTTIKATSPWNHPNTRALSLCSQLLYKLREGTQKGAQVFNREIPLKILCFVWVRR